MKIFNNQTISSASVEYEEVKRTESKTVLLRVCKRSDLRYGAASQMNFTEFLSENYISARTHLIRITENNQQLPDLIIIDLPFIKREVTSFVEWLNKSSEFHKIPVIYNKCHLNASELRELQVTQLVDDIVDVDKNISVLPTKSVFLKKVKEHQFVQATKSAAIYSKNITVKGTADYILRRALDILISSCLIVILLPVLILISIAIKLESRGSIIYLSHRAGRGYRIFKFYKFRTMFVGADNKREELEKLNLYSLQNTPAQFFKIKDDPRVTKVGAFLRNTSLDELPQLFNVLKGDMSIVGNRPLPLYEAATLTTNEWAERFMAPAGITGLWQIKKRGREDMSVEERINLDISYAKNNDLLKDLWILAQTPNALFQKINV
jgi:lipopolysaccharide/colanic/teichoic acid biosynthesis glycosyltransferase